MKLRKNRKKRQVKYDTNADYDLSKDNIGYVENVEFEEDLEYPSGRGLIDFLLKNYSRSVFFTKGIIQVTYRSEKEHLEILDKLSNILVSKTGVSIVTYLHRICLLTN